MSDFLLVHGGLHGAWCWRRVVEALNRLGHRGQALDLPGAGDHPTPRREVTATRCLDAVDRFVAERGIGELVAVGHSIAGMLLPGIVTRQGERVREVVFLAALVPDRGVGRDAGEARAAGARSRNARSRRGPSGRSSRHPRSLLIQKLACYTLRCSSQ